MRPDETPTAGQESSAFLTHRGLGIAIGSVICAVAAIVLGYRALLLVGLVGALTTLAIAAAVRIKPTLSVRRRVTETTLRRGDTAKAAVRVVNRGRLPTGKVEGIDHLAGVPRTFAIPALARRADEVQSFEIPTKRRGHHQLGPLVITNMDVLGLARRSVDVGQVVDISITPRVVSTPEVARSLLRSVDGPESQSNLEGTLAFHSLREYMPGDDLRHIHWKASARGAGYLVKQFIDTARPSVAIICDLLLADHPDPYEALDVTIDCAASFGLDALGRGQPLWLHAGHGAAGEWFRPVGDRGDTPDQFVAALTDLKADTDDSQTSRSAQLAAAIEAAGAAGRGSLAVLVTSASADQMPTQLVSLTQAFAVGVVVRYGPADSWRQGRLGYVSVSSVEELPQQLAETGLFR